MLEHILGHAKNTAFQKALGYSLLIFGNLIDQKPHLVSPTNILGPLAAEMHINHKLYEGHHFINVPSRKNIGKMKENFPKTILEFEPAIAPKGQSSSIVLPKSEILDRSIRSHKNMLAHLYEQQ